MPLDDVLNVTEHLAEGGFGEFVATRGHACDCPWSRTPTFDVPYLKNYRTLATILWRVVALLSTFRHGRW
jgi:hypothetical protein